MQAQPHNRVRGADLVGDRVGIGVGRAIAGIHRAVVAGTAEKRSRGLNGAATEIESEIVDVYADHKLYVPGQVPLTQIQAGGNGVWAIGSSYEIFHLDPSTWWLVQIPGALVSISVGSGGGVWGLDSYGKAYGFTTP